jgi:hypothetical protein
MSGILWETEHLPQSHEASLHKRAGKIVDRPAMIMVSFIPLPFKL